MTAAIVVGCSLLLFLGVLVVIAWGNRLIRVPVGEATSRDQQEESAQYTDQREARTEAKLRALRRYFWWANVVAFSALVSAVVAAWPGGRLIMRILAHTSPDSAQGRLTEAQFNIGFPTFEGSMALLFFGGLPAGYFAALLFVVLRRWLPAGRLAGPVLGAVLLLWFGALLDPLRADNIDFTIVEPGWLAVALFCGLAVLHGAVVAAAAGWWSGRVPLWRDKSFRYYTPLLIGSVVFPPAGLALGIGALLLLIWMSMFPLSFLHAAHSRRVPAWVGTGVVVLASAAALPAFVSAVISITSRTS
jgi:hypothetical protein